MVAADESPLNRPPLWPSLLLAAILAIVLPLMWLVPRDTGKPLDFHIFLAVIYIPLAFGIIWPALVGWQALTNRPVPQKRLLRNRVAPVLFVVSFICWVPLVKAETELVRKERAEELFHAASIRQQAAGELEAQNTIAAGGILAFTEPLKGSEGDVLVNYIRGHALTPTELLDMSKHYQTAMVMNELALQKACPPEALEILLANAMAQRPTANPASYSYSMLEQVLTNIGKNANTSPRVLVKMVESDDPIARMAAAESHNLPKAAKIAYLKKACDFQWEREIREAGQDPDTPPEVLECLANKPSGVGAVAANPHTPVRVVETLSHSDWEWVRKLAQENLDRRRAATK
jgi:hypothetical protein